MKKLRVLAVMSVVVLLLAGCARTMPEASETLPTASASNTSTVPSESATPTLKVGVGASAAEKTLAAICAQAIKSSGTTATLEPIPATTGELLIAIEAGEISVYPGYAATFLEQVLDGEEPPAPEDVVSTLAQKVAPQISLLQPNGLDAHLVWATTDLNAVDWDSWVALNLNPPPTVLVPTWAQIRADGTQAVEAVYGVSYNVEVEDDTHSRQSRIRSKEALVGAFRAIDVAELEGLKLLEDSRGLMMSDLVTVLFTSSVADSNPDSILKVNTAMTALTAEEFAVLETQVAAGADPLEVVEPWVAEHVAE